MRLKFKIPIFLLCMLLLFSCTRQNPLKPSNSHNLKLLFEDDKIERDGDEYTYLQKIVVEGANSEDLQFAYQIKHLPDQELPGYHTDSDGWIIFNNDGIYSSQSELNFYFDSKDGVLENLITEVKVLARHPDGRIEELYSPYKSNRLIDSEIRNLLHSGYRIPAGMVIQFQEKTSDVFIDGMYADHFMYRLNILNQDLQSIETGEWFNSIDTPDIRNVHLSMTSMPSLSPNVAGTYTELEYYVVSRLGVQQAEPNSIYFEVYEDSPPIAMFDIEILLGYGQYHYTFTPHTIFGEPLEVIPGTTTKHNRHLWPDDEGRFHAIHSDDFKLHLAWDYLRQEDDIPINTYDQDHSYFNGISAFWMQHNSEPFPIPDTMTAGHEIIQDADGSWIRILNSEDHPKHVIMDAFEPGLHKIRLKVEDFQGIISDPAELEIVLSEKLTPSQRSGILIIDDDVPHNIHSPEDYVDQFYFDICSDHPGEVQEYDVDTMGIYQLSAPLLDQFETILIHCDNMNSFPHLIYIIDALDIYLNSGGNLIISSTDRILQEISKLAFYNTPWQIFLENCLGISNVNALHALSELGMRGHYFIGASSLGDYPDIPVELDDPFHPLVGMRQALNSTLYFDETLPMDFTYDFICKEVDDDNFPPTQEEYDLLSQKKVAYKHQFQGSNVYFFGFPLSYMQKQSVKLMMDEIFSEIHSTNKSR